MPKIRISSTKVTGPGRYCLDCVLVLTLLGEHQGIMTLGMRFKSSFTMKEDICNRISRGGREIKKQKLGNRIMYYKTHSKGNNEVKREPTDGKKIFVSYISERWLISKSKHQK